MNKSKKALRICGLTPRNPSALLSLYRKAKRLDRGHPFRGVVGRLVKHFRKTA